MRIKIGLISLMSLIFFACATTPKQPVSLVPQDHFAEIEASPVPLVMNDRVQDWINYFQGNGRDRFELYLQRSGKYIPMMRKILRQYGLPEDLVYLAMIESGFNPHAYSRARATGAWQFIYRTGVRYGLRVDTWVDERRDPEKSTVAAAKYLKDLHDRFNHWYLAAAGYNAGEGKIDRAIRRYRTEDFWEMSRHRYLKRETKDYVPKLIAAAFISKDPGKYGFKNVRYEEPVNFDTVTIDSPTDLRVIAQCAGVPYEEIKLLNPELTHWVTPPNYPNYRIKIPAKGTKEFLMRFSALTSQERFARKVHEVKNGETLQSISRHHGLPAHFVASLNGLSSRTTLRPGHSVLIPDLPPEGERFRREFSGDYYAGGEGTVRYRVRRGDNLWSIGRRVGVSATKLRRLNPHVSWGQLRYGTTLKLALRPSRETPVIAKAVVREEAPAVAEAVVSPDAVILYQVQEGDTLWEIARKHSVSVRSLRRWNGLGKSRRIQPGQTLKIYPVSVTENKV